MTDITDEDLKCIALELNRAWERIAELEKQGEWISVDKFIENYMQGECWIYYKGRVLKAYQNGQMFLFNEHARDCYMTECISAVMRINKPEPPKD